MACSCSLTHVRQTITQFKIQNSDLKISSSHPSRCSIWHDLQISKRKETSFCTYNTEHVPTPLFGWFGFFLLLCLQPSYAIEINNGYFHLINTTRKKTHVKLVPSKKFRVDHIPSKSFDSLNCAVLCCLPCHNDEFRWETDLIIICMHTTAERLTHTSSATTGNNIWDSWTEHTQSHSHTHIHSITIKDTRKIWNVCISLLNCKFTLDIFVITIRSMWEGETSEKKEYYEQIAWISFRILFS